MFVKRAKLISKLSFEVQKAEQVMSRKLNPADAKAAKTAKEIYAEMKPAIHELKDVDIKLYWIRKDYKYNFIVRFFLFIADKLEVLKADKEASKINAFLDKLIDPEYREAIDLLQDRQMLLESNKIKVLQFIDPKGQLLIYRNEDSIPDEVFHEWSDQVRFIELCIPDHSLINHLKVKFEKFNDQELLEQLELYKNQYKQLALDLLPLKSVVTKRLADLEPVAACHIISRLINRIEEKTALL